MLHHYSVMKIDCCSSCCLRLYIPRVCQTAICFVYFFVLLHFDATLYVFVFLFLHYVVKWGVQVYNTE